MRKIPLFPSLYILGAEIANRVVNAPITGVFRHPLSPSFVAGFSRTFFGRDVPAADIPREMLSRLQSDADRYTRDLRSALTPLLEAAAEDHARRYGLDPRSWSLEGRRAVYSSTTIPVGGGHAVAVVTLEPLQNAERWLGDPSLIRCLMSGFPGSFYGLRNEHFLEVLRGGRAIDGTPTDVITNRWHDIVTYNAELFRTKTPLSGYHAIGANSYVVSGGHTMTADARFQTALMLTTCAHSQDGSVPWSGSLHPERPDVLICATLHSGSNAIPGGDMINTAIAEALVKTVFRRGATLASVLHELPVPEARRHALLLDPLVSSALNARLYELDPKVVMDSLVLVALDALGGKLPQALRLMNPRTAAILTAEGIATVETQADYDRTLREGIETAKSRGYTGAGGFEIPASAERPIVPVYSSWVTRVANPEPRHDPHARGAPITGDLTPHVNEVVALSEHLDWKYLESEVESRVRRDVNRALDGADVLETPTRELLERVPADAVARNVEADITPDIHQQMLADPASERLQKELTRPRYNDLVWLSVVDPFVQGLELEVDGRSYIDHLIERDVLHAQEHALATHSEILQMEIAATTRYVGETSAELNVKQEELERLERELAQHEDAALREQHEALSREIERERAKLEEVERERRETQMELEKRSEEIRRIEKEAKRAEEEAKRRANDVYKVK